MKKVINEQLIYEILSVVEEIPEGKVATYGQIAKLIGSAREVVTRMLKYFSEEGIVRLSRGQIEIISYEKLKNLTKLLIDTLINNLM